MRKMIVKKYKNQHELQIMKRSSASTIQLTVCLSTISTWKCMHSNSIFYTPWTLRSSFLTKWKEMQQKNLQFPSQPAFYVTMTDLLLNFVYGSLNYFKSVICYAFNLFRMVHLKSIKINGTSNSFVILSWQHSS